MLKSRIGRLGWRERREKRANDGRGLFEGGNVGGRADLSGGEKASSTKFDGEEGLISGRIVEIPANDANKRMELEGVKVVVDGREGEWVGGAERVVHFGEREAMTK